MKDLFTKENKELLFKEKRYHGEFVAESFSQYEGFTRFAPKERYSVDWCRNVPGGFVVVVYQRHSVYRDGEQVYVNKSFIRAVSNYCRFKEPFYNILLDVEMDWQVQYWKWPLKSSLLRYYDNTESNLNPKYFTLEEAVSTAIDYSKDGRRAVVLEFYQDVDRH